MDNLKSKYTVVILVRGSSFVVFTREIIKLIYFCYSATEELRKHPLILSVNLFFPLSAFYWRTHDFSICNPIYYYLTKEHIYIYTKVLK